MYERVLLALDLEGVNNVAGEPYTGLSRESDQWYVAREQAVLEINAAADALFRAGISKVGLWDNHGGGGNLDLSLVDARIVLEESPSGTPRMRFAEGAYDCICFFGYHAMEGTLGGVLAHTMNSRCVQFYKLNGCYIGEVDIDVAIAASHGISARFFAGGDIACRQASRTVPDIVTVVTKEELSRNRAVFRENDELLREIGSAIVSAVQSESAPRTLEFPAVMEKSFKRTEDAASYLQRVRGAGIDADYLDDVILGKDAHTVVSRLEGIEDLIACI